MLRPRVLVIDDEEGVRRFISRALEDRYTVLLAADGAEGLSKALKDKPHLIILDIRLPDTDGLSVLAKLKARQETRPIPVTIASVRGETDILIEAQQAGAVDQLIKPFTVEALRDCVARNLSIEALEATFAATHAGKPVRRGHSTLLVIDDEPGIQRVIQRSLQPDFIVEVAGDGEEGLQKARRLKPQLIFLDLRLPDTDGLAVLAKLKADAETAAIAVIIISGRGETDLLFEGRQAGAADYLIKPFSLDTLRAMTERHIPIE